tara:strand:+ start:556 stop:1080 length:525 start_codon:yes stop_codon:yes gene_type:complete
MSETDNTPKIYRYKFSDGFLPNLLDFASTHRYDDPNVFKEKWHFWIKENKDIIDREKNYLNSTGYEGDILKKMYKSARYYFKNKSLEKIKPKKRRQYIGLDRDFLDIIDEHLNTMNSSKPSDALTNFLEKPEYQDIIKQEIRRLKNNNLDVDEIHHKIKKTYKNRHYTKERKTE